MGHIKVTDVIFIFGSSASKIRRATCRADSRGRDLSWDTQWENETQAMAARAVTRRVTTF